MRNNCILSKFNKGPYGKIYLKNYSLKPEEAGILGENHLSS
jgi:hypothetical protein